MTDLKTRLAASLARQLENTGPQDRAARDRIIAMFSLRSREGLQSLAVNYPAEAARAEMLLAEILAEQTERELEMSDAANPRTGAEDVAARHATASAGDSSEIAAAQPRSPVFPFIAGLFTGLGLVALLLFAAVKFGVISQYSIFSSSNEKAFVIPEEDVAMANMAISEILSAIGNAKNVLESDPESVILENTERFFQFSEVFPEVYKTMSAKSRVNLGLIVRKNGSEYKILASGPLCPLLARSGEAARDPVREKSYSVLCHYAGIWSEGGRDF